MGILTDKFMEGWVTDIGGEFTDKRRNLTDKKTHLTDKIVCKKFTILGKDNSIKK